MSKFFSSDREYTGQLSMRCSKCDWVDNALSQELSLCPKCNSPVDKSCSLHFGGITIEYDGIKNRFEIGDTKIYNADCFDTIIFFMRHFRDILGNSKTQKLIANFELNKDKYKDHKYFEKNLSVQCSKCSWQSNNLDTEIDLSSVNCPQCNHSLSKEGWMLTFGGAIIKYNYILDRFELSGNHFNQGNSVIDNADCPDTIEFMLRHFIYYDYYEEFNQVIENESNKAKEIVFFQEKDILITTKEYVQGSTIYPIKDITNASCKQASIWSYLFSSFPIIAILIYTDIRLYDYPLYFYFFTFVLLLIALILLFLGITAKQEYSVNIQFNNNKVATWKSYDKIVSQKVVDALSKAIQYNKQNEFKDKVIPIKNKQPLGELIKKVNIYTILRIITIILLFAALFDQLSEYYVALKFVVFCITGYGAYLVYENKLNQRWLWTFVVIALLFNPFIPVQLDSSSLWGIIDIVVAIIILVSIFRLKEKTANY